MGHTSRRKLGKILAPLHIVDRNFDIQVETEQL